MTARTTGTWRSGGSRVRRCLDALVVMARDGRLAADEPSAGLEVELALVDDRMQPAMLNHAVLDRSTSPSLTSELGSWNLEINSPPRALPPEDGLVLEHDIRDTMDRAAASARAAGARPVSIGILPTLDLEHLRRCRLTDDPRYGALDDQLRRARGAPFHIDITAPPDTERADGGGVGEYVRVDLESVAAEAACTSMQLHLQLSVEAFPSYWNAAQALAGVQVAVAANSPFLLGRRLWAETRVPLFAQAVDTRSAAQRDQGARPRVWFGERWASSAVELFEQNVAHFDTMLSLSEEEGEDPFAVLEAGRAPALDELCRHNSTIWRWNRPVYDVAGGVAHLRLENRVLPAAPTALDAAADAMFFYGLVRALAEAQHPPWHRMTFEDAEANLIAAARRGILSELSWPDCGTGDRVGARELVLEELLPQAADGLSAWGVDAASAARYLEVIEQRCRARRTGATWQVETVADLERAGASRGDALRRMLELYAQAAGTGAPVHTWD